MEYLGDTVAAIAREKAAIIKRGDRAVTGADGDALAVDRAGVPSGWACRSRVTPPLEVMAMDRLGHDRASIPTLGELRLGLLGRHQAANAAVALGHPGRARGTRASPTSTRPRSGTGFAATRWPGRLELLAVVAETACRPSPPRSARVRRRRRAARRRAQRGRRAALAAPWTTSGGTCRRGPMTLLLGILRDKEVAR